MAPSPDEIPANPAEKRAANPPSALAWFRAAAAAALTPRDTFGRLVLALVALRTPVVWLTAWLGRGEPMSVTAIYRPGGDIQYYELVGSIGRGNFGEPNLFESAGQGLHPFPLGSIWLHSLFFAALGPWGIFLADTLITIVGYVVLVLLARACRLSLRAAVAFSGFVCGYLYVAFTPLTDRFGWMRDLFWGDRFPRPFLTELYVAMSFAVLVKLWLALEKPAAGSPHGEAPRAETPRGEAPRAETPRGEAPRDHDHPEAFTPGFWVLAALVFTLLLQSDVYSAFTVGLGYAVIVGTHLLRSPARRGEMLRGTAVFVVVLLATIGMFVIQQRQATPDLLLRWGAYPLSRLTALSWVRLIPLPGPILVTLAALAVLAISRTQSGAATRNPPPNPAPDQPLSPTPNPSTPNPATATALDHPAVNLRVVAFWCLIAALAAIELPLFFAILGKGLYPYQVIDRLRRVCTLAVALIVLTGLAAVWPRSPIAKKRWLNLALAAVLIAGMVAGIGARAAEDLRREDHTRSWYKLGPGAKYRTAFTELVRELAKPTYKSAVVLGTFDQQVHVYWQTFVGGRSFVPDGFVSVASNAEMERRFVLYARAIGAPTDTFLEMVQASSHNGLVFVSKYAASSIHAMAPLSDYTEAQRRRIAARGPFEAFGFEVPISELERLRKEYEGDAFRDAPPRLDLVVLNNDERFGKLAPPSSEYDLVFHNAMFRLFARKGLLQ